MKIKFNNKSGVTLVALAVTVVILLILAGISLSLTLGNNGIITKAKAAKMNYTIAQNEEEKTIENSANWINEELQCPLLTVNQKYNTRTQVRDEFGNKLVIPEGFKILNKTDTTATHVPEGIVISDDNGNEFVWIPVGDVYANNTKESKKTIELGRYSFDGDGTPYICNDEVFLEEESSSEKYIEEDSTNTANLKKYGNTIATNINAFKKSATDNGGFYIGRYEARTTASRDDSTNPVTPLKCTSSDVTYNYISQNQASTLSKNLYTGKSFTSDLINSYEWDTALVFAQTFGNNNKYSAKNSANTSLATKGTNNETTKDKICNIYDMASNCWEWTTETYDDSSNPCTERGGVYSHTDDLSRYRYSESLDCGYDNNSFRVTLIL